MATCTAASAVRCSTRRWTGRGLGAPAQIRAEEMDRRARSSASSRSSSASSTRAFPRRPAPPLPEGASPWCRWRRRSALVSLIRRFRPHVITTYDERAAIRTRPHQDTTFSVHAFDAAGTDRVPRPRRAWQPRSSTTTSASPRRARRRCTRRSSRPVRSRPYTEWLANWDPAQRHLPPASRRGCPAPVLPGPRRRADRARDADRPGGALVRLPAGEPSSAVADEDDRGASLVDSPGPEGRSVRGHPQ